MLNVNMQRVYTLCEYSAMTDMGERLKEARARLFKSARQAALKYHWAPSTYSAHENGQNEFGPIEAKKYGRAFKTDAGWLLTGEGNPGWGDVTPVDVDYEPRPENGILEIDIRAGLGGGGSSDHTLVVHHGDTTDPVKSESWHFPHTFVRNELRRPEDRIRIIETYGDSMAPTIHSGDRVIIDTDHRVPSPDGLYAIRDRFGSIVVKRLQALRRGNPPIIKIISDNPHHGEEEVTADELEEAIIGRVLWGLKRL
jgi:phage repressor protein C with HTH and peptisase S24 domain